jgi:dihydroorotate dehydrogenase (NAD+) catalytic subunit
MLMAGATVAGVGSAVYYRGVEALTHIGQELANYMTQQGVDSVVALQRLAHKD